MKQARALALILVAATVLGACADMGFTPAGKAKKSTTIENMTEADRGFIAMQAGDLEKAERHYIKALNENPKDPYANLNMGVLYHNTGHFDLAKQYYRVMLSLNSYIVPKISAVPGEAPLTLTDIAKLNLELLEQQTGNN